MKSLHAKKHGHFYLKQPVPLYKSKKCMFSDERYHTLLKLPLIDNVEEILFALY